MWKWNSKKTRLAIWLSLGRRGRGRVRRRRGDRSRLFSIMQQPGEPGVEGSNKFEGDLREMELSPDREGSEAEHSC